jgi:hypothetical protein
MFFAEDRIEHMRTMILADNEKDRRAALKKLLPMQRADFVGLFKAMESLPGHHPPARSAAARVPAQARRSAGRDSAPGRHQAPLAQAQGTASAAGAVEELHEQNPMLGLRGCRLGIAFPEITEMQARAIIEAAVASRSKGGDPHLEIMIPLIGSIEEMRNQAAIVRRVAEEVFKEKGVTVDYMVGTMIELPRAALTADQIAEEAEFFSFGTNDLTQTTFGISRDDINQFLPAYMKAGIFKQDPFATLDQAGVGSWSRWPPPRAARPGPTSRWASAASMAAIPSPSSSATDRPQLRLLLALPSADGKAGSRAGRARREADRPGPHHTSQMFPARRVVPFARHHSQVVLVGLERDLVEAAFVVHHVRRVGQQVLPAQLLGDLAVDLVQVVLLLGLEVPASGARGNLLHDLLAVHSRLALARRRRAVRRRRDNRRHHRDSRHRRRDSRRRPCRRAARRLPGKPVPAGRSCSPLK